MMPRCLVVTGLILASAATPRAAQAPAAAPADQGKADAATVRRALEGQLAQERARLERLQAELQQAEAGGRPSPAMGARSPAMGAPPAAKQESKPAATKAPPAAKGKGEAAPQARPCLAAADLLYKLGRYAEARSIYEAAVKQKDIAARDRVWALLQAGNSCRRLGDFDAALAHFQTIPSEHPDAPWFKDHVEWALRTVQWEKRWHRQAPEAGEK
jgi:tetratricopeptide (TPR) repeat protein